MGWILAEAGRGDSRFRRAFLSGHAFHLWHPVNDWIGAGLLLLVMVLCLVCRRTPLEVFSPRADRRLVGWLTQRAGRRNAAESGIER